MAQSATGCVEVWVSGDGGDWSCGPSTHYRIATPVFDHGMMVGRLNTREDLAEAAEQSEKEIASGQRRDTGEWTDVYVALDGNWAGLPPRKFIIPGDVFAFLVAEGRSSFATIGALTCDAEVEALVASTRQELASVDEAEQNGQGRVAANCSLCGKLRALPEADVRAGAAVCSACSRIRAGAAAVVRARTETKACGHLCTTSSLKEGCCACLDQRPLREGNSYPQYVDGVGWKDDAGRDDGYCPFCRRGGGGATEAGGGRGGGGAEAGQESLESMALRLGLLVTSAEFASHLDASDSSLPLRSDFHYPHAPPGAGRDRAIYLCGNSLGLQPLGCRSAVLTQLDKWAAEGVEGHFTEPTPWLTIDDTVKASMATLVGAAPLEVVLMNSLTSNLHFMMAAFFRPSAERFKILIEKKAFPSDVHAVTSQLVHHGLDPRDALVEIAPRDGEVLLRQEDIDACLEQHGPSLALVLLSGVQYYTGQLFDIERITRLAHAQGSLVGWDLAHAVGNVPLRLHDWGVDFACWCSYKYLNSGPGSIGGCFVHDRHGSGGTPRNGEGGECVGRLAGWWGHRLADRFVMDPQFIACPGADGFRVSNPPVLLVACVRASLDLFEKVR